METKQQIRKRVLNKRNHLPVNSLSDLSKKICRNLQEYLKTIENLKQRGVYGYYPHGSEVSLISIYQWLWEQGIPLAFPRVLGDTMDFYHTASFEDFMEGAFHIMEPKAYCKKSDFEDAICLVPGSVFDYHGNRYGYGKGYYDRYFALHGQLYPIGIAYDFQIEETIPTEDTDVKMKALVSENRMIYVESIKTEV